jgi:cob(I)alamin adenosyltransferase
MRNSFLNDPSFFVQALAIMICVPLVGALFTACISPSTPEEKAEAQEHRIEWVQKDMVTISPRPGVECYVLPSGRSDVAHVMSCVVIPKESN